ncbi:hypothetical protein MKFW12EY_33770 [Methylomonas koyamae]|nr:hypothetical protein MKFW12EY_33770 [Methylomonas koyamae]
MRFLASKDSQAITGFNRNKAERRVPARPGRRLNLGLGIGYTAGFRTQADAVKLRIGPAGSNPVGAGHACDRRRLVAGMARSYHH